MRPGALLRPPVRDVLRDAFIKASKERKCHLFVRAHANLYDYQRAFESVNRNGRVHYLAFLRDPVKRALSEHDHITNGLVAQFGPHVFGKAWDYDFTDRTRASLSDWLMCTACRVGASNRQARFLARSPCLIRNQRRVLASEKTTATL